MTDDENAKAPPAVPGAWVVTLVAMLLAVPTTYAFLRARDVLFGHEPNPATIVWSAKIAMFWRLAIGGYVAGMVAPLAYLAARRDLAKTIQALYLLALVIAGMITIQGLLLP